jgi:diphthamide biosynthesis protein 7
MYHLSLSPPSSDPQIIFDQTLQYFPEDILITAFQWHPKSTTIGMTLTNGDVCLRTLEPETSLAESISGRVVTHDLETWVLAFTPDGLGVYSGGDDSALKFTELAKNHDCYSDAEVEATYGEVRRMPWSDRKIHGAGVTAILPFCSDDDGDFILTGSYDDHIRLIQAPVVGRRIVLAEMDLGGGVWRLKRLDTGTSADDALIFASCMYAGARILSLKKDTNGEWQFEVLAKFEEHKSMNYGSDCQPSLNKKGQRTFVTTSFYDRLLCLWQY